MRPVVAACVGVLIAIGSSAVAAAQESILSFSAEPPSVELVRGGRATLTVRIENLSVREADDIELMWTGGEGISLESVPASVSVLGAFASTTIRLTASAAASAPPGEMQEGLEAIYSYCIDDLCYQMIEPVKVAVRVALPASSAPDSPGGDKPPAGAETPGHSLWPSVVLAAVGALLVVSWSLRRATRLRVAVYGALAVAGGLALGFGVSLGQHSQAQAVGAVLCTSCVGIETVETARAELSETQAAAVDGLTTPVDLLVFTAPWCRSCPYAKALVGLVSNRNPLVRYRLVEAEVERDLAERYGVARAGRIVVPAIVRPDTGDILFGTENLADRLLGLLREAT